MTPPRDFTAGMWVYGQIVDRYATDGYNDPPSTLEIIEQASASGLVGLDLNYPWPEADLTPEAVAEAMKAAGLETVCITPVIYNRPFRSGSFSSTDSATRKAALELSEEAVGVARLLGARYVKFWPGQDGYDYPFQVDYAEFRKWGLGGIREIASNHPDVSFAIEYKLKEPRNRMLWSTAAATLVNIDEVGLDNLGVVLDFGHSLFAKENPSESLQLLHSRGRLVDVELDDNYREWDDDLTAGSINLVETLEFLYTLGTIGWASSLKLDLFPYRENRIDAIKESITTVRRLDQAAAGIDPQELARVHATGDALAAHAIVRRALLG